jgi:putative endonuclease
MYFVYILKSINFLNKTYIGYTLNIQSRLKTHNNGGSIYTKDYRPWELVFYCGFQDKLKAMEFEKYLKSHSGRAFTEKRLLL